MFHKRLQSDVSRLHDGSGEHFLARSALAPNRSTQQASMGSVPEGYPTPLPLTFTGVEFW